MRKRIVSIMLCLCLFMGILYQQGILYGEVCAARAETARKDENAIAQTLTDADAVLEVVAPSAILMEASTGQVIYEKSADVELSPASITKIMTLVLIFDAIESGKISLSDEVTVSAHAQSMGGSQVFLAEGEIQTVETLIKCIVVASGNDASVAMAEYVAGSEEAFVKMMNERAASLGMEHTHFEDCCGLSNSDGHYTSARDVAVMSRELITKYPEIFQYSTIWMEDITHVTRQGTSNFTLTSTNKLLKQYQWTTGLKTGSTNKAKYCFSGTACKDGISLIAVVMAAPDYKVRFEDAMKMLQYGYSVCALYEDKNEDVPEPVELSGGMKKQVGITYQGGFSYLDLTGADLNGITKEIVLEDTKAPVIEGQKAGEAVYYLNGKRIGSVDLCYTETVRKAVYKDYLLQLFKQYLM